LREQRELAIRGIQTCSIAMMDIDRFKLINDSYGHPAGDKVLAAVAGHVMRNMRPYDKLFRYGGEEFVICLPGMGADAAFDAVERLRKGIESSSIAYDGKEISVTSSFGIVVLEPESTVEQSVDRADKALLAAKSAGRNCARLWDPSM
jgi:diguanylate cyclase (GGDEF)-like protein